MQQLRADPGRRLTCVPSGTSERTLLPRARPSAGRTAASLDFCEAQGYEVATTFAEEAKSTNGAAFSQLIDYLKKPEKGFITVVAPVTAGAGRRCGHRRGALSADRTPRRQRQLHGRRRRQHRRRHGRDGRQLERRPQRRRRATRCAPPCARRPYAARCWAGRPTATTSGRATAWSPWKTRRWSCATSTASTCTRASASA